jgi:hypothetical protein|tara:strand:+ start:17382 stop:17741 length:360 start_codon:yes stop_codon:yes gene_type:complete
MSRVYHVKSEKFGARAEGEAVFPDDFKLVAFVPTEDLERVHYLTNHIDSAWTDNPSVVPVDPPHRSTSVGDVVVTEDGVFKVDIFGFKELDAEAPPFSGDALRGFRETVEKRRKELADG